MGKKTRLMPPRVVLDTNVLVSALVFRRGRLAWCREAWQAKQFVPLVDRATASELMRVLAYPKFKLSASEREQLLAEFLPHAEVVARHIPVKDLPELRDADDMKFLALAKGLWTGSSPSGCVVVRPPLGRSACKYSPIATCFTLRKSARSPALQRNPNAPTPTAPVLLSPMENRHASS